MRSIIASAVFAASTISSVLAGSPDPEFNPDTNTGGQGLGELTRAGLTLRAQTELGCYSSPGKLYDMGVYTFQTTGWCQPLCIRQAKPYFAMVNGTNCFCGDALPDSSFKEKDTSNCDTPCSGYNSTDCGGTNYWDFYSDGYRIGDPTGDQKITVPSQTYTYSTAGATSTPTTSSGPATVVVTQAPTTSAAAASPTPTQQPSSGTNKGVIAAGVVVAVLAISCIAAGVFLYLRHKKQKALAEEQRRHEMMTNFVTAEKPGSSYTSSDARLDPSLMFQRRMSAGSIRDNEDYSRRILKVANPDY